MVNPASTVVYRTKPAYRFEVDGQPFPFHITEDGATFAKDATGLYRVTCVLLPCISGYPAALRTIVDADGCLSFEDASGNRGEFPWHITGPVFISAGDNTTPLIALTFIAEDVDTDTEVAVDQDANDDTPTDAAPPLASTKVLMPRQHGRPQTAVTKAIGKYASLTAPPGYEPVDYTGRGA